MEDIAIVRPSGFFARGGRVMPDTEGRLSYEERQKVNQWLVSHGHGPFLCPLCKQQNWGLADHVVNLMVYRPREFVIGGPTYPCVQLICNECCSVQLLNAVRMGLVKEPPPLDNLPAEKKEVGNG